ncbi:MAG: hypothetical protein A3H57_02935 [Candidatus Taylorbacteria bacterium RIFCSPLOWO2_02_FULL_43_11]|nr:MAG: hypothetical protein A2743_03290 [Candidatus Taylorbacteria bacterium RIFCSPHIGHO2_01_FULL_43_47]OHA37387.1 MAG: hypothetical protein A3H57_02935 [Candidatus Taylorbacteria bacterium RIFCSPLOWO2_02_FULL_43_11]
MNQKLFLSELRGFFSLNDCCKNFLREEKQYFTTTGLTIEKLRLGFGRDKATKGLRMITINAFLYVVGASYRKKILLVAVPPPQSIVQIKLCNIYRRFRVSGLADCFDGKKFVNISVELQELCLFDKKLKAALDTDSTWHKI